MNITAWIVAGGIVGWIGFFYLRFNAKRSPAMSIMIGMAGGVLGGALLAPLFQTVAVHPDDLNLLSLFTASAVALAAITITDMVLRRLRM